MSFDIALSGIHAIDAQLDNISNNIANSGTYGFKSSRVNFGSMMAGGEVTGTQVESTVIDLIEALAPHAEGSFEAQHEPERLGEVRAIALSWMACSVFDQTQSSSLRKRRISVWSLPNRRQLTKHC